MFKRILILLVVSCLLAVPAFAKEAPKSLVQVTGTSQQEVTPDIAKLTVSIHAINPNLEKAKNDHTQRVNQVLAALRDQAVKSEQIKTHTYRVEPVYNYEKDRLPKLEGYRVTNSLEVRTGIDNVGAVVNAVTTAGANEISSIRFEVANEADSKNEALKAAVNDAMQKAAVIAAALNKKIANITLVNESGVYYQPLAMDSGMLRAAKAEASVPNIPAGLVTISATVQVTVELE